ncbi:Hypothetical protein Tpal_1442 [Trichococcus palustris]|uniref:Metallo-beta-lactamase domain-containing protein n=1 Tax=Trichococcus palustris TaxID=140314 RepID=A0A143YIM9_9LACT|nr:Hypothetical protein Tpal_1442 [Trichococcus palustris]SFL03933.1 Metallo-beta-lactamase superfamily protein [Trichococcus palustris]
MELTILGYMGGYPTKDVGTTSYLLTSGEYRLLIDAGSNALLTLEHHLDPLDLDAVILTHYHADHIADLGVLQYTFQLKEAAEGKKKRFCPSMAMRNRISSSCWICRMSAKGSPIKAKRR